VLAERPAESGRPARRAPVAAAPAAVEPGPAPDIEPEPVAIDLEPAAVEPA
jgi:hypothetical protein